jgi:hypothetical protein
LKAGIKYGILGEAENHSRDLHIFSDQGEGCWQMPNGKPGDHPITDMLIHGKHPFPEDMEEMIRKLHAVDPSFLNDLGWEPFDWADGKNLEEGRKRLKKLLEKRGR